MMKGIDFLPVAIGLFGMGEVLFQMENIVQLKVPGRQNHPPQPAAHHDGLGPLPDGHRTQAP